MVLSGEQTGRVITDAELAQSGLEVPDGVTVLTADEADRSHRAMVDRVKQQAAHITLRDVLSSHYNV